MAHHDTHDTVEEAGFVVGVDGCKRGWIAAELEKQRHLIAFRTFSTFADLLGAYPESTIIGVDVPIGLFTDGGRICDGLARKRLGFPRSSSVFSAPDRRILGCATYDEANAMSKKLTAKGISRQTFGIMAKIAEVDAAMTSALQGRVIEVHPEVSFWAINHEQPMSHSKKRVAGFEERRSTLLTEFPHISLPATRPVLKAMACGVPADDALDAVIAAWSAHRFAKGISISLPDSPEIDSRDLAMAITY